MIRHSLAALLALFVAGAVRAHDTFLLPDRWQLEAGEALAVALSSASTFPAFDHGPDPERITALAGLVDDQAFEPSIGERRDELLALAATPPRTGTLVIGLTLGPRDIELEPDSVDHYFDEIRPGPTVLNAWAVLRERAGEAARLRETYTKHAKALVCVAPCPAAAARTLGHALEFVPLDPLETDAGSARFVLVANSEPAPNHPLNFWTADGRYQPLRSDALGVVTVPLAVAGPAMLSAVKLRPPAREGGRFESDFATLTFAIHAPAPGASLPAPGPG